MSRKNRILIVGAGFAGAVLGRELAENADLGVVIVDARDHLAGNCHTERDAETGVMVHRYGPHIFNTEPRGCLAVHPALRRVPMPFIAPGEAPPSKRGVFSGMPINLLTINQFFGRNFSPTEAREFIGSIGDKSIGEPRNFEEQALRFIGRELYEAFFYGYSKKQWGCEPRELSASILKRLPVRFDANEDYYTDPYQGMPVDGYTALIERMTAHPNIEIKLATPWEPGMGADFDHVVFTGPLDQFYGHRYGRLGYRTVYWENRTETGDFQKTAVMNYPGLAESFTRIVEHKHFAPWETHAGTYVSTEYSKETEPADVPFYPKRLAPDKAVLAQYLKLARAETRASFVGRLATYRYLDMHQVIGESLDFAPRLADAIRTGQARPILPEAACA